MDKITLIDEIIKFSGPIIAAIVTVVGGSRISNRFIENEIKTYSSRGYDVSRIMKRAKKSIYIVADIGDKLWDKHKYDFARYMKSGVNIYWLILSEGVFLDLNKYIGCDIKNRENIIDDMKKFQSEKGKEKKKGMFFLKKFDGIITSSYIAVDIDVVGNKMGSCSSVIHLMPYCYQVGTSKSPIVDIYPDRDKKVYKSLRSSIKKMWDAGTPI